VGSAVVQETESSEETIRRVLSGYQIGRKIRQLRLKRKRGLVELGKSVDLSPSLLSQLENEKLVPTIPTLVRIASVFDVSLDYFFKAQTPSLQVTRAGQRMQFPENSETTRPAYFFQVLAFCASNKSVSSYLAEFPQWQNGEPHCHEHQGSEFLYVISGQVEIAFEGEPHTLKTGDCVYFDARGPHSYKGLSDPPAEALVITAPSRI
jgi:mannose-6-phosphate isomerase-like protein (cupin superfamily)